MEGEDDEGYSANSEMRYIALELMKLAQKSGKPFEQVAEEYIVNTARLQEMVFGSEGASPARKGRDSSSRGK
jgi:hypothetical protein